jgi:two-component system sensor histidine kinase DesK
MWVIVGLWALSFALWPFWGWDLSQLWAFVGVVIGMSMFTMRISYLLIALLTTCAVLFQFMDGARGQALVWSPAIIASVSVMMTALSRQVAVVNQLRATQHELARLAVEKERSRVARDIHDILGHSLTAITVKTEAVGRLIPIDPAHAVAENAEVEKLARGALADVRSAVTAFRTMSVLTELAHARSILASAGIAAELPPTTEALPSLWRELGGWIVREGVTNVIRHSQATRCRILFNADFIEVADDGHGAVEPSRWEELGNGLRGLRERAEAAGLSMTVGRSADLGGFLLRVRTATAGVSSARPRTDAVNNGRSEY